MKPSTGSSSRQFWAWPWLGLAGCSSDGDEPIEPNPLPDFKQEVSLKESWSRRIGDGQGEAWLHLKPAVVGDTIFSAGAAGRVMSLDRGTGRVNWSVNAGRRISGGAGAGEGLVLLGTRDGHVIALDAENGNQLWESAVNQ